MNFKELSHNLLQKSYFLPLVIVFTYLVLVLDTIKYPGFIGNHFLIDAKVYFAAACTLLLFSTSKTKILNLLFKLNNILFLFLAIAYLVLVALEGSQYRNYILAKFHFHIEGLVVVVLFSAAIYICSKLRKDFPKKISKLKLLYPVTVFLLALFFVQNITFDANYAFNADAYILFHPLSSFSDKMYYQWGDFYRYMVFIKENTPENATIVIPPEQDPWLIGTGNPNFVRAFIYPRNIVQETKIISDLASYKPGTFIMISWGKEECKPDPGCHGWPKQNIKASKIIYKDPDSSKTIETKFKTIYTPEDKKYVYGLIEI